MQNVTANSELISDNCFHCPGQSSPGGIHILEDKNVNSIRTLVLGLCLLTAFSVSGFAQQKSLFERLGGKEAISAVVDDFAGNVLNDTRINKKFSKTDPARLLANLKDFVCFATGGPCRYTGLSMKESHKNMGTTAGEFNALVEDLVKTLNKFNVPAAEQKELLGALAGLRSEIVESESSATGGDLPANFKPAPPLAEKGMAAAPSPAAAPSKSLFDRLGGMPAISAVVDDFAGNVLNDSRINKKFAKTNAPRLLANLKDFVCFATGGPCKYTGLSMKESHKNMGTTGGEFNALVEDLVKTLNKFNVPAAEQKELLGALAGLRGDIVENESSATGTALPSTFKPAPPLGGAPMAAAPAASSKPKSGSLFDRLGGMSAISAVVDDFAGNVLGDSRINQKFSKTDAPRLLANLKDFVCFATGGPCQYNGLSMKKAHEHMRVTGGEFNALVEDMVKTLDKFNVGEQEKKELLTALAGTRADIVKSKYDTSATGTPVGPSFKPAPPLGARKGSKSMKNAKDN
jgi:hemoglobin